MKFINQIKVYTIMRNFTLPIFLLVIISNSIFSQTKITGLSGWNIYLDPGHSQYENMGIYNYSEAEKNLGVALNLRQMLLDWTDIDTVYICRTNNQQLVDLSQRTDQANALGAAHYHSIHSDAATMGSSANSTLIMWGQIGIGGPEKTPHGGKKMSQIMVGLLTAGMRTTTRGAMGDRDFYQVDNPYPYLWVNRETNMASELSEAGFHTNPTQNQLNMNDKWKRLEAKTMFWTILKYHNIQRPFAGTVVGIVKDIESGQAINGATVTLDGQTYTTDTWASLFYKYSSDTTLLRNGFYYFENIPPGTNQLQVNAAGYEPYTVNVTTADTFFTFQDINMISTIPPKIVSTVPVQNDSIYPGMQNILINFSRPMDKSNAQSNIFISPAATATFTWTNGDKTLTISTSNFTFETDYQITIKGTFTDKYGHPLDGNGDGTGGDDFTYNVKTKVADMIPPVITNVYPSPNSTNVELKPIISVSFDELLKTSTISTRIKVVKNSDLSNASYILRYYTVNGKAVLNFFITTPLAENEIYTIKILAGVEDQFGNPTPVDTSFEFTTGNSNYTSRTIIDNFEGGIANWWQPTQSGNTVGVITAQTNAASASSIFNLNTGSTKSEQFNYAYNTSASTWLIRQYRTVASPTFDKNGLMQVFIFGDGNNNKFRFCVREINGSTPTNLEVSPWYNIDWIGWKLVTWDLSEGQTGTWLGNGTLEPPLVFDSFQFTYVANNVSTGTYYLDDLRIATFDPTDVKKEDNLIPDKFVLEQNYPNPFNPSTEIKFSISTSTKVKLIVTDILGREVATLLNDDLSAGNYSINFNAQNISSGVYFYTLITDNFKQSRKMILMK